MVDKRYMKLYALMLSIIFANVARADTVISFGFGVFGTANDGTSQVKIFRLSEEEDIWRPIKRRISGGIWADQRNDGNATSLFGTYQIGFHVEASQLEAALYTGPCLITTPDASLGGYFQFNHTLLLAIRDAAGNSIGVSYNHFSNAGLNKPNLGKDFAALELKIPL